MRSELTESPEGAAEDSGRTVKLEGLCVPPKQSRSWVFELCGGATMRTARMELLRTLVSERLSAAAREIFDIVERTILEYEEEMFCSKWVNNRDNRRLDVPETHAADFPQMCATDVQLQPVSVDVGVCLNPDNSPEPAEDHPKVNNIHPHSSPVFENHHRSDQEILMDGADDGVKQECDMEMTLDNHDTEKLFRCPVCFCGFSSKRMMVRHFRRHPEDKSSSYQCQFCPSSFLHKSEFILHMRSHQGDDPEMYHHQWDCQLIHRKEHTQEKPSQCLSESDMKKVPLNNMPRDKNRFNQESLQPLCMYQIQTVGDMAKDRTAANGVKHIKTEPADSEVSNSALDNCLPLSVNQGEQEDSKHLLKNILHEVHSGNPPQLLISQFETQTAQKPHRCPVCSKSFSLKKTLIRHLKMHSPDKAYRCQLCGRQFCQKSDLANHTRIHTGERPHQCPRCPKAFVQRGNLNVHMRTHAGEKLYQCSTCSCSFDHKTAFEFHMQGHTP